MEFSEVEKNMLKRAVQTEVIELHKQIDALKYTTSRSSLNSLKAELSNYEILLNKLRGY